MEYDLHTHSDLSDGRDRVGDMVRAAEAGGLDAIAITDHLEADRDGRVDVSWVEGLLREVEGIRGTTRVQVLAGVESSALDWKGRVTATPDLYSRLDLVVAGLEWSTRGLATFGPEDRKTIVRRLVDFYCCLATNPVVDIIAHPFNIGRFFRDVTLADIPRTGLEEAASAFQEGGVAFELNNSFWWWFPDKSPRQVLDQYAPLIEIFAIARVPFVAGSDAHSFHGVGQLSWVRQLTQRVGLRSRDFLSVTALRERRFLRLR